MCTTLNTFHVYHVGCIAMINQAKRTTYESHVCIFLPRPWTDDFEISVLSMSRVHYLPHLAQESFESLKWAYNLGPT